MIEIGNLIRAELDRRFPEPEREPDWEGVLDRLAASDRSAFRAWPEIFSLRRARRRLVLAAVAVLATVAVALVLVAPWSGGPGFVGQALAALGSGRYVHAVFRTSVPSIRIVSLTSGRTRPLVRQIEWIYDTRTGAYDARIVDQGVAYAAADTTPDPAVSRFASGYRNALASGEAHVVADTRVNGHKAKVIRFAIRDSSDVVLFYEDVVVAMDSHRPLLIRYRGVDAHGRLSGRMLTYQVVSIGSSDARPSLPTAAPQPSLTGDVTDIRTIGPTDAASALGRHALWPGRTVGTVTLKRLRLQRVTTKLVHDFQVKSSALGLKTRLPGDDNLVDDRGGREPATWVRLLEQHARNQRTRAAPG